MFWGQLFVKNAKIYPRILFKRPKSDNFINRENAEIAGNSVKMAIFDLQNTKTQSFFKISTWNFVFIYTWHGPFTDVPFLGNSKISSIFLKIIFFVHYCRFFPEIFNIMKISHTSLIERFILNLLLKTNCFYSSLHWHELLHCLRDSVSRKPLFMPKTGKT